MIKCHVRHAITNVRCHFFEQAVSLGDRLIVTGGVIDDATRCACMIRGGIFQREEELCGVVEHNWAL